MGVINRTVHRSAYVLVCLLALLSALPIQAERLIDIPLRNLLEGGETRLAEQQTDTSHLLLMLFAPDCRYCHFQVKHLNQWRSDHPKADVTIVGIGVNGQLRALRKEAFSLKADFPLLMSNPKFARQLGDVPATPILVLLNGSGELIDFRRGAQNQDSLTAWLAPSL